MDWNETDLVNYFTTLPPGEANWREVKVSESCSSPNGTETVSLTHMRNVELGVEKR